jgi:sulfatase modifying factor 1
VETCGSTGTWSSPQSCGTTQSCVGAGSSASCQTPPSCATFGSGTSQCGSNFDSCCTSFEVTGGSYDRTYQNTGGGPTGEADPASLTGYRLDKYEVTVGRFRAFVAAWNNGSGYTPPAGSGKHTHLNGGQGLANSENPGTFEPGWVASDTVNIAPTSTNLACGGAQTWTNSAGSNETLPMNCVNWFEAYAFCIWDGGFLPSDAEFGYAQAGGNQQREYPWGTAAPSNANSYAIYGCFYPNSSGTCNGVASIAPVGTATLGAGAYGQLDLTGEVFQWTLDSYATFVDPCTDCSYILPSASSSPVGRGDYYGDVADGLYAWGRFADAAPTTRAGVFGFRCARTP